MTSGIEKKRRHISQRERALQVPASAAQPRHHVWLGPLATTVVFLILTAWSWRKWPDLLVDFGQQLYTPWQLAKGKHLYTDIAFLHGPFSQYFNAFLFRIFGPSLTVLIFANLSILAATTAIIYATLRSCCDRVAAFVASVVFLCVCGFSQYVGIGNYNYVSPYVHEATHGIALTAGMILSLSCYLSRRGRVAAMSAGVCLGLAALTKVDVALAAALVAALALAADLFGWTPAESPRKTGWLLFVGASLLPAIGFFIYFLSYLSAEGALRAVATGFSVLSDEVASNPFYLRVLGLDDVAGNVTRMLTMFGWMVAFVLAAAVVDVLASSLKHRRALGVVLGSALFGILVLEPELVAWRELPSALPLTTALALAAFVTVLLKSSAQPVRRRASLPMVLWTAFGLVLLAKMALNTHVYHYGFYLAMPALVVTVVSLTYWLPEALRAAFGSGGIFRSLAFGVIAAGLAFHLNRSQQIYSSKTLAVGAGGDAILTYKAEIASPASVTVEALRWINENMRANATFVALPEGIMLNYLSRRQTTVPQINYMMTEAIVFGEGTLLASLEAHPPDYVLLVAKDTSEFGVGRFGTDPRYGYKTIEWVDRNYSVAVLVGDDPILNSGPGIKIFRRNQPAP